VEVGRVVGTVPAASTMASTSTDWTFPAHFCLFRPYQKRIPREAAD